MPEPDDHPSVPRRTQTMQPLAAMTRLAAAAIPGAVLGLVVAVLTDPLLGVLAAINAAAALFIVTGWIVLWPLDADPANRRLGGSARGRRGARAVAGQRW